MDCKQINAPKNGTVQGILTTYPNILEFACDYGFALHGSMARKCQKDGTWSGSDVFCEGLNRFSYEPKLIIFISIVQNAFFFCELGFFFALFNGILVENPAVIIIDSIGGD